MPGAFTQAETPVPLSRIASSLAYGRLLAMTNRIMEEKKFL
jgi:hypothetical protein